MLLQRLKEYADHRMELPPQLYSETAVRYIIELTVDGRFLGMTDTADPSNAKTKRGQRYLMPQVTRAADSIEAITMQCIVCGQQRPVLSSLQGTVKGLPGGKPSGAALISANERAFESYGLENSLIAPTCANCGERFTKAMNELLASE